MYQKFLVIIGMHSFTAEMGVPVQARHLRIRKHPAQTRDNWDSWMESDSLLFSGHENHKNGKATEQCLAEAKLTKSQFLFHEDDMQPSRGADKSPWRKKDLLEKKPGSSHIVFQVEHHREKCKD